MEYPSGNDFYLKFKATYRKDGNFEDYVLMYISDNFYDVSKINPGLILGKKFSEIAVDNSEILGFKDLYFTMTPKSKIKYEIYLKEIGRWYLIVIYNEIDDSDYDLIIYYIDITDIRQSSQSFMDSDSLNDKINGLKHREKLFYRDFTTGLYNKNFFEEELSRLDTKRQLPISIIMGDINGLKLINDAFGHKMGDRALKRVAEIMTGSFREEDILCRVGGDEFVALLPKTTGEAALEIIERIKLKCEINPLDFLNISISLGAATKESKDEDIDKVLKKAEDRMYFNKLKESKEAKLSMIEALKTRLEKIAFETKSHYERLKILCMKMADALNLPETEKEELRLLCEFHDIGKVGIPENILQKQDALNNEDWEHLRRHSEIGYYISKEFKDASPIDELILIHHERWDGKGYPGLLKNEEIPVVVRIFAIADAYDVMVNERPYKAKMSSRQALLEIKNKSGSQFDPNIAKMFIKIMEVEDMAV